MAASRRKPSAAPPPPSSREADLPALLDQLRRASGPSALDQRRALLIQSQLAQTERQLLVLSEASAQRRAAMQDLSDSCGRLLQLCRQAMAQQVSGPVVPVQRAHLASIIERCGIVQGQLTKQVDDLLDDRLHLSSLLPNRFAGSRGKDLKLRDLASSSQGLAFLNLGRVRALEAQLTGLFKALLALSKRMDWVRANSLAPVPRAASPDSLETALEATLSLLPAVTKDVGELGILIPSSAQPGPPGPNLGDLCSQEEEARRCVRELRRPEARAVVEAQLKVLRQRVDRLEAEKAVLEAELALRETAVARRAAAADSLLQGLQAGCVAFRGNMKEAFLQPLEAVLAAFEALQEGGGSEVHRRELFLAACREHFPLLQICASQMSGQVEEAGDGAASDPLFAELRAAFLRQIQNEDISR